MKKLVCFVYDGMVDFEISFLVFVLTDPNNPARKEVKLFSDGGRTITTRSGIRMEADASVADILEGPLPDGLILPGGYNLDVPAGLTDLITRMDRQKKLLAAICAGPWFLAAAGVLKGRPFTTGLSAENIRSEGRTDFMDWSNLKDRDLVVDGHIITARFNAFIEFAAEVQEKAGMFSQPGDKDWIRVFKEISVLRVS
jgi:putative intracellular protease/amidase